MGIMPITPFLGGQKFDPETKRIMGVAFEMARKAVKRDWGGLYASHSGAIRIMEVCKDGERSPNELCRRVRSYSRLPRADPNESPGTSGAFFVPGQCSGPPPNRTERQWAALVSWSFAPADQPGADGKPRPVACPWRVGALG